MKTIFCSIIIRSFVCNTKRPSVKQGMKHKWVQNWQICQWTPQSIEHRWLAYHYTKLGRSANGPPPIENGCLEDHYTEWFSWQTDPAPSSNWPQIHGRPLHQISFMTDWPHPILQLTVDPWKTTTPHKFHM